MPRFLAATWRPLAADWNRQRPMAKYDLILLHTMVGTLWGTDGYFRADGYGGNESHFGVGHDGDALQWQDTLFQAEANGTANPRAISIETADIGTGFPKWNTNDGAAVPAWTPAQIESIARICAWASVTHGIPLVLIPDSKPNRRGVGYHRQGCEPWRVPGGELWSASRGKVCPGNRRIAQVPAVIARAREIVGSAPRPPAKSAPTVPAGTATKDDNMIDNRRVEGSGDMRLIVPVGKASHIVQRAWLSAAVDGPGSGWVRAWFQTDTAGISDVEWNIGFKDGRSVRPSIELPDGCTQVNIQYKMPDGGALCVETLAK